MKKMKSAENANSIMGNKLKLDMLLKKLLKGKKVYVFLE